MNSVMDDTPLKILIADDSLLQRSILTRFLGDLGYITFGAKDGLEALSLYESEQPDLVILDIMMPKMDGIAVAEKIRTHTDGIYIPIVFISSLDRDQNFGRCMAVGADGFITKPFNPDMLAAKILSLFRLKKLYEKQLQHQQELTKYKELFEQEQLVAANLYKNILQADFVNASNLRYLLSPMALFNGDILLSTKAPGNQFYVLLGDFTGHGLSASIGAAPTADIFYGMARKGFSASDIIKEINRKLHKLLPVNMFLGATLVTIKQDFSFMEVIACGLPEHFLVNRENHHIRTIASKNMPLGIVDTFEPEIQYLKISENDYLYLFTDGVIEAENTEAKQFGTDGVMACLQQEASSHFDAVLERLHAHTQGLGQQDDVTFVELHCSLKNIIWPEDERVKQKLRPPLEWNCSMTFSVQTIKHAYPVPILINLLMEIQGLQRYQEVLFCILNELFTNAVDFGVLGLDPVLKQSNPGLIDFYSSKDQALCRAEYGEIRVSFTHQRLPIALDEAVTGGRLTIEVQDSGQGFDVNQLMSKPVSQSGGIGRVQELSSKLKYNDAGNCATATFDWAVPSA